MGCTPRELEERLSSVEITELRAFFKIEDDDMKRASRR
jgi:hypothetical protein